MGQRRRFRQWSLDNKLQFWGIALGGLIAIVAIIVPLVVTGDHRSTGSAHTAINVDQAGVGTINYGTINNQTFANPREMPNDTQGNTESPAASTCAPLPDSEPSSHDVKTGLYATVSGDVTGCWTTDLYLGRSPATVTYLLSYTNTSTSVQKNVVITLKIPDSQEGHAGSVTLINGNYPNGYTYPVTKILGTTAWGIGDYNPGIKAYLKLKADTPFVEELACGSNDEVAEAWITPNDGHVTHVSAAVHLYRTCTAASLGK